MLPRQGDLGTARLNSRAGLSRPVPYWHIPHLDAKLLTEGPQPINALLVPLVPAAPNQL